MQAFKRSANVLLKKIIDLYAHKNSWILKIMLKMPVAVMA